MRLFSLLIFLPLLIYTNCKGQAHLGSTETEIRNLHPDNTFSVGYANNGQRYIYTKMAFGVFSYYFDSTTNLSVKCLQIPNNLTDLNTQVQIYNQKYVITSKTSWTAYLEGGGIMYIKLIYSDEYKLYEFIYTNDQ
jgi:hypothetical protein